MSAYTIGPLDDGLGIHLYIGMDGNPNGSSLMVNPLPVHKAEGNNFIAAMQYFGWKNTINKVDDKLKINDLRGSGSPYNNVNLGVFIGHGAYGTSVDYEAYQCKQMYFQITSSTSAQYLRMSEMNLGGSGTNGLMWFAMAACYSLYEENWQSMQDAGVTPYNGNLHLLLGSATISYANPNLLANWARYMNHGTSFFNTSPLTVKAAWYQAAKDAYRNSELPTTPIVKFAVAGDTSCMDDSLQSYYIPSGSWRYDSLQVYPRK